MGTSARCTAIPIAIGENKLWVSSNRSVLAGELDLELFL